MFDRDSIDSCISDLKSDGLCHREIADQLMDQFDVSQATAYRHLERFSKIQPLQTDKPAWLKPYQQINSLLQRAIARDDEEKIDLYSMRLSVLIQRHKISTLPDQQ